MHIQICRKWETSLSVCGELTIVDNSFKCFTIEPSRYTPVHPGHPCIISGLYPVKLTMSPHLGYMTPEILNVPGRSDIRWHIANKPSDLKGCAGVGSERAKDWVSHSGNTFEALMKILTGNDIIVEYIERIESYSAVVPFVNIVNSVPNSITNTV